MKKEAVINWIAETNYTLMNLMDSYYFEAAALMIFLGAAFRMSPILKKPDHTFTELLMIKMRILIVFGFGIWLFLPIFTLYIYDASQPQKSLESHNLFISWIVELSHRKWWYLVTAFITGYIIRFCFMRFIMTYISALKRKLRFEQQSEKLSDIRDENKTYKTKDYLPSKFYKPGKRFVGLDKDNQPYYIDEEVYRQTHHQIIGPTRYGKGVLIGGLIDQAIRAGDQVFYYDPKEDKFLPKIMYAAAKEAGRPFYFIALHDKAPGSWHPFSGGDIRDIISRAVQAFQLHDTGDPATDFYKVKERKHLSRIMKTSKTIEGILRAIESVKDEAQKLQSKLQEWSNVKALNPKSGKGFSIEKAILEGAVVYVQGSLTDNVVRSATKAFITETMTEVMRLQYEKKYHSSLFIDEVKFLISKEITDALATIAGFGANITLAYQSMGDTLTPDDITLDGQGLTQSININCQLKTIYGGFDPETAKFAAESSGTINKTVTQQEKTEIKDAGAELWDEARSLSTKDEYLIPENVFYSLPPRVCIQFQPATLATVCHTAFVPVADETIKELEDYLTSISKSADKEETNQSEDSEADTPDINQEEKANKPKGKKHNQKRSQKGKKDKEPTLQAPIKRQSLNIASDGTISPRKIRPKEDPDKPITIKETNAKSKTQNSDTKSRKTTSSTEHSELVVFDGDLENETTTRKSALTSIANTESGDESALLESALLDDDGE